MPRVCVSTLPNPQAGKSQFWEHYNSEGGRYSPRAEGISPFSATDKLAFHRGEGTGANAGKCIISIKKNGHIIKTANSHEWGNGRGVSGGCGSGYFYVGHYNTNSPVCLRDVDLP